MAGRFVPDEGDVIWLQFNPQAGREQAGRRPALVLSPERYNRRTGLLVCCPLSTQVKGYTFEVPVDVAGQPGVVLSDQVKSFDWRTRGARRLGSVPGDVLLEVRAKLKALLSIP